MLVIIIVGLIADLGMEKRVHNFKQLTKNAIGFGKK